MAGKRRAKGEGTVYRRKSDGLWTGQVTVGRTESGKPKKKAVYAKTEAEAIKKLRAVQSQLDKGLPPTNDAITVSRLLEMWLNLKKRHVASSAHESYEWAVRVHLAPALGNKRVTKLTAHDVDQLLTQKIDEKYSTSTVLRIRSVLCSALDQAMKWDITQRNVARMSEAPTRKSKQGRSLTPEQARELLEAVKGDRLETLYIVMLALGLRRGEALGLEWSGFSARKRILKVQRALKREKGHLVLGELKNTTSRRDLNLPDKLVQSLVAHRDRQAAERRRAAEVWQENGLIFTTQIGTPFDLRNLNRAFDKVCDRAGLGHWTPHELRHSATSLMLAADVPMKVVSDLLGHSTIRMTADVYAHTQEPDRQEAADAMAGVLWN